MEGRPVGGGGGEGARGGGVVAGGWGGGWGGVGEGGWRVSGRVGARSGRAGKGRRGSAAVIRRRWGCGGSAPVRGLGEGMWEGVCRRMVIVLWALRSSYIFCFFVCALYCLGWGPEGRKWRCGVGGAARGGRGCRGGGVEVGWWVRGGRRAGCRGCGQSWCWGGQEGELKAR